MIGDAATLAPELYDCHNTKELAGRMSKAIAIIAPNALAEPVANSGCLVRGLGMVKVMNRDL